jgi:pantoate--beta-alanine ligase
MGALHEGHLSLVSAARRLADLVVVTIFVNPTQFGPGEDFDRYPRSLERDTELSEGVGAHVIFAPAVEEMYPAGEQTRVTVSQFSEGMCGVSRPGHFVGVATIVAKLFHACGEATYVFGQKDYQQWRLIERMARDLLFPVSVVGAPTVREADGLAMSSRNAYLKPDERERATVIPQALQAALDAYRAGERDSDVLRRNLREMMEQGLAVDYIETRDPYTWEEVHGKFERPILIGVAGKLGKTRLIDNVVLTGDTADIVRSNR